MTSETNRDIALHFLTLAFSFDVDKALELVAEDASWWVAGPEEKLAVAGEKNHRQIEKLLRGMAPTFPGGLVMEIIGVTADGPRVAVEVEGKGTAVNGRTYHNHYHFMIELRDRKIVRVKEYMDTLHLATVFAP